MDSLLGYGALGVVGASLCIVLGAWLVGAGIHLYLVRLRFVLRGAAFTVGAGLAVAVVSIQTGYFLFDNVLTLFVPAALGSLGYSLFTVVQAFRGVAEQRAALHTLVPAATDWMCAIATTVALYPLIRLGLGYFSSFVNDFPDNAAASEEYLSRSGIGPKFLYKHPDDFGLYHLFVARFDKPGTSAIGVFAKLVSGVPTYASLAPISVVSVFVLTSSLAAAIRRVLNVRALTAACAAIIPAFSIIPMSRVRDAQIGHAMSVALLAVFIYSSLLLMNTTGRRQAVASIGLVGVVLTAAISANPTLMIGAGLSWGALLLWLAYRLQASWRPLGKQLIGTAAVAAVLMIPIRDCLRYSLSNQTDGGSGYDIPVPSPFAPIGFQANLTDVASTKQTLTQWVFVLVAFAFGAQLMSRRRSLWATFGVVAAVVANGAYITQRVGVINYAMHKWESVVIAIVIPFLIARLASLASPRRQLTAAAGLAVFAMASAVFSWRASDDVPDRVSPALFQLANDDRLADLDVVNVNLKDIYENSIAAMALPSDQVVLVGDSYSDASAPIGDQFVLHSRTATAWGAETVSPLGHDYVLASVDLTLQLGETVWFGSDHPESERFVYGPWYLGDPTGVSTTQKAHRLAFDVPAELRGSDVEIVLHGTRFATIDKPRELIVRLDNGRAEISRTSFNAPDPRDIRMTIPAEVVDAADGRVVLFFETPNPLLGTDFGLALPFNLGFFLQSLTINAAR